MPDVQVSDKDVGNAGLPVGDGIKAGLRIALIGSAAIALVECLARLWVVHPHFEAGVWPWRLILATYGKFSITHLMLWCCILPIFGVGYSLIRRRSKSALAEPFLLGTMLVLVALFLVRPALLLAAVKSRYVIEAGRASAVIAALACYPLGRILYRRAGRERIQRPIRIACIGAIPLYAVSGYAFYESPFLHRDDLRVSAPVLRKHRPDRPNILWIDLDTVRADRMSCYGYERGTTPFLEEWAEKAIVFDRAVADGMWTVPTHAAMFTGKSVRQHGMDWGHLRLDDDHVTVADRLGDLGYHSLFLSNNVWLTRETRMVQGFQTYHNIFHLNRIDFFSLELLLEQWGVTPFLPWMDRDFGAKMANHLARQWLDGYANNGEPLFVFVNYMEAHLPYSVPRHFREMYMGDWQLDRSYDLHRSVYGSLINAMEFRYNVGDREFLDKRDRDVLRLQYDASVRYLDDKTKELIGFFENRGLINDTLVIITSDHGEYLGAHQRWTHTTGLYEELTHVALLLREPGRQEGLRVSTPVQQSDLYLTIMNAVRERFYDNAGSFARDLFEIATAGRGDRIAVSQTYGAGPRTRGRLQRSQDPAVRSRAVSKMAVTDGRYKYILSSNGRRELYDLQSDSGELHNVFDEQSAPGLRLSDFLAAWLKKVPRYSPKQGHGPASLDPDTIDALKSLGYIGSEQ